MCQLAKLKESKTWNNAPATAAVIGNREHYTMGKKEEFWKALDRESPTYLKLKATSWYRFMRRALIHALLFDTHTSEIKFAQFVFN